jgi:CubicO group peptidase (beta-lactamase class C family)
MKKTKSILIFLTLFTLLVNNAVYAQISTKEIDALVEKAMKEFNVAGVAVAVVKDGKIIHEKGYGVRSIDSKQPVNEHTNFQIASNSKAFTTAALAILVEEGKLSWKDKVKTRVCHGKFFD